MGRGEGWEGGRAEEEGGLGRREAVGGGRAGEKGGGGRRGAGGGAQNKERDQHLLQMMSSMRAVEEGSDQASPTNCNR